MAARICAFFFLVVSIQFVVPSPGHAALDSYVPVGNWAYEVAARLVELGLVPSHLLAAKPLTREEFARLVLAAGEAASAGNLGEVDRQSLDLLAAELAQEIAAVRGEAPPGKALLQIGVRGGSGNDATLTTHPDARPGWTAVAGFSAPLGAVAMDISGGWADPPLQRAYLSTKAGIVNLQLGRDALWWGPGTRGALLLSDNAGPLDMLKFSFEIPHIRYTKFAAILDEPGKYLFGTRIDWSLSETLRLGISDTVLIFAGPKLWYAFARPIPLLIMFEGNYLLSVDFDWVPRPGTLIYGELMFDDIQSPFPPPLAAPATPYPNPPSRWGFLGGVYFADPFRTGRTDLRVEYARVYNWTYADADPTVNYSYRNLSLGHWLGPDGDDLAVTITHTLTPASVLKAWIAMTRHGEGRLGTYWPSIPAACQNYFLSGVVEARYSLGGGWEHREPGSAFGLSAELSYVENRNNISGNAGWDYFLGLTFQKTW